MLPRPKLAVIALFSLAALAVGCGPKKKTDFTHPLQDGMLALEKISPAEYPDFTFNQTQAAALSRSAGFSIDYLKKTSSKTYYPYKDISHDRALASCVAFKALCDQQATSPMSDADLKAKITSDFEVYRSIGGWAEDEDGKGDFTRTVLFTGYFTPIYDASMNPDGEYKYPLYKRPRDLLNDPEGITASRMTGPGQYSLYYTRSEIEQGGAIKGNELVYLKSRWDAYVISVQGSAKLRLRDGRIYEVGYSGNNGFPYESPGRKMLAEGKITKEQLSLKGLKGYFDAHPADMDEYLSANRRFVFFSERPGGPFGSLNEPVTPFGTVATDKVVYPRGMPSFVTTQIPTASGAPSAYNAWLMDQDAGGGIRAAGRADLYMGTGPDAEQIAGHQLYEGKFFYIALKENLVPQYLPAPTRRRGAPVSTEAAGN